MVGCRPHILIKCGMRAQSAASHFSPNLSPTTIHNFQASAAPAHLILTPSRSLHCDIPSSAMTDNQASTPESSSQGRGGRRRGRGGTAPSGRGDSQHNTGDGEKRPKPRTRGGGRGSGGDIGRQTRTTDRTNNQDTQPSKATTPAAKKPVEEATDDADDGEVCFICASAVEHTSVSPCNHRTCHICALRLRALYKNRACAHCRV